MTAEAFTVATQTTPGLQRLLASLAQFQIPITILARHQSEYRGHGWRWKTFIGAATRSSADVVIHCDGYDSICLGPLSLLLEAFAGLAHPIIFAYEPQEQPEFWMGLQPGLMIAERDRLISLFDERVLEEFFPDHFNDQHQIQCMYSWNPRALALDTAGEIFYTLGERSADLVVRDSRLINPLTGSSPSFVHAPRNWDLSSIERWIAAQQ